MASCHVQGEPELYGLGIRVAFYIQWFGTIVVAYLEAADLPDIRLVGLLFSAAALIGLVVRLSVAALQPADIYIVLLLAMGIYLPLVPLYAWKAVTGFDPYWDPFRWSNEPSRAFRGIDFTLLLATTSLAIWYWCSFVPENPCSSGQYGFLFSRVSLGNKGFIASSAIMYFGILLVCLLVLLLMVGWRVPFWRERRKKKRRVKKSHVMVVKELRTLSNTAVAATLTAAVELTVSWNDVTSANHVSDVAQVLPLLVSAGFLVRVLFLHFAGVDGGSESSGEDSDEGGSRSYRTESPGGLAPTPPPPAHARR
ncbi:hypothetical protein CTA2_10572 [Colletotrichum tanaceti]|uniref:Uncharacterized protein n=1 Tax=Colletotrichum tanaceti TaxID=1306861 RepID=A0A4U6X177_9PEZI|nr:hypothetical protein CTA2_10572 [Colletotrichum tanaceti]TKW48754.1 hypothetical protein CTA1_5033 [Colletotrichum tanaceti]